MSVAFSGCCIVNCYNNTNFYWQISFLLLESDWWRETDLIVFKMYTNCPG